MEDFICNLTTAGENFADDEQIMLNLQMFEADDYGRRRFSVQSQTSSTLLALSIFDFQKILIEFPEFSELLIKQQVNQTKELLELQIKTNVEVDNFAVKDTSVLNYNDDLQTEEKDPPLKDQNPEPNNRFIEEAEHESSSFVTESSQSAK